MPKSRRLSFAEREEITLQCARDTGVRAIARKLGRSPSTMSCEIRRNSATCGEEFDDRAFAARRHADRAAKRLKANRRGVVHARRDDPQDRLSGRITMADGIAIDGLAMVWKGQQAAYRQSRRQSSAWSPEQIAQRLKVDFPEDPPMRISYEAIYRALYIEGCGAPRRELSACLRFGRAPRLPCARARSRGKAFVADASMIRDHPAEIDDIAVADNWEGDLVPALGSLAIGLLVDRATRSTRLLHLPRVEGHGKGTSVENGSAVAGHGAEAVRDAIAGTIGSLPFNCVAR